MAMAPALVAVVITAAYLALALTRWRRRAEPTMQPPANGDEEVPVLIDGGGAGLTASMLLGRQGVRRLLVSAARRAPTCPKHTC
jgi:hypothetical protein